jgi:hypothetical protein
LACRSEFAATHLDEAFWKAPGRRYLFGASMVGDQIKPNFQHIAEYNGADRLTVVLSS